MNKAIEKNFIKQNCKDLYFTTENLNELFEYLEKPIDNSYTIKDFKEG